VSIPGRPSSALTPPSAGTYDDRDRLDFTIAYSAAVTVDKDAGTPALTLTVGTSRRLAYWVSGSGTDQLVFRYTVQPGDKRTNGIALANDVSLWGWHHPQRATHRCVQRLHGPATTGVSSTQRRS